MRVSVKTVGCRLNQAESALIAAQFEAYDCEIVPFKNDCELCVINTCTVTKKAELSCIQICKSLKKRKSSTFVILAGCAVNVADKTFAKRSGADLLVNRDEKFNIPALLSKHFPSMRKISTKTDKPPIPIFSRTRAIVKIQDGCDFNCAYCIVPFTRGKPVSRNPKEIIREINALTSKGFKEVVLTGANIGTYKHESTSLVNLIQKIEKIKDISRIRLSSIEISTVERNIIRLMADSPKLCPSIHLPLQSGDNATLSAMGRRYGTDDYLKLIEYALSVIPNIGIGTDIIVGLPGESDWAHENTLRLVRKIPFSNIHVFTYSIRPLTQAANMTPHVSEKEKKRRADELRVIAQKKKRNFAEKFIGKEVTVLMEKPSGGIHSGRTPEYLEAIPKKKSVRNELVTFTPELYDGRYLK